MRSYLTVAASAIALMTALMTVAGCENLGRGGSGPTPSSSTNTLGPDTSGFESPNSTLGTGSSGGGTSDRDTGRSSDFVTGRSRSGPIGSGGSGVSGPPVDIRP